MIEYLEQKDVIKSIPDDTYVLLKYSTQDKITTITVNVKVPHNISERIVGFIDSLERDRVVLVCRTDREPFGEPTPGADKLSFFQKHLKTKSVVFYQDPWPEPVPKFNSLVLRFGFDQGCELDKLLVEEPTYTSNLPNGDQYLLVSNKDYRNLVTLT